MEKIILVGNGGHAKSVVDSIESTGQYEIVGFTAEALDDNFEYRGYKIVGTDDNLKSLYQSGIKCAFVCIGYMGIGKVRDNVYNKLKEIGYTLPTIIDTTAMVAKDASIAEGTFVGKKVVVNSGATIGKMAIINTAAIIEHDCTVGDFTHVAVNATLCGAVSVETHCLIGANTTIIQEKTIGENSILGAGTVVVHDIERDCTALGAPAKVIKRKNN